MARIRPGYVLLLLTAMAAAAGAARAAQPALSDQALIQLCIDEIQSRQPEGDAHSKPKIARSQIKRGDKQDEVSLDLSYAEGRPVSGRCIIRDGKVFDLQQ